MDNRSVINEKKKTKINITKPKNYETKKTDQ